MYIESTNSTNDLLRQDMAVGEYWTTYQTAGRGQQGNVWESEKGKNILLSMAVRPGIETVEPIPVRDGFRLTMAVSLGICEALDTIGVQAEVKWPNDIYVGDKKICGTLIESSIEGRFFAYNIVGIGLNVNQRKWVGDAPNPTSIALETGKETELIAFHETLMESLQKRVRAWRDEQLKEQYMARLYRREGLFAYRETATGKRLEARIKDITDEGCLVLETADGSVQTYLLKQIQYIL